MAVNPLYTDKSQFLLNIRMSTVQDAQTLALVDVAIQNVRMGFIKSLGADRTFAIVAYAPSENPTTPDEITRTNAAVAEVLWTTALLVERLPHILVDGYGEQVEFNNDPLKRDASYIAKYKDSLMQQVDSLLGQLETPVNNTAGQMQSFAIGAETPVYIGQRFVGR